MFNQDAKRTELHTDASAVGLAAILFQSGDYGQMHLVFAISKKVAESEEHYHSSKLELLAIVWAMQQLRDYFISLKFTIASDCQA